MVTENILEYLKSWGASLLNSLDTLFLSYWSPHGIYSLGAIAIILYLGLNFQFVYDYAHIIQSGNQKKGLLKWMFPVKILKSRSLRTDLFFSLFNAFLALIFLRLGMMFLVYPLSFGFTLLHSISQFLGFQQRDFGTANNNLQLDILYVFAVLIASNFGAWISHYLMHKVGFLWEFHKVHHSATQLTGFTNGRTHIVEIILSGWAKGIMMLFAILAFQLYTGSTPSGYSNATAFLMYAIIISPTNFLLHAPYWISFGPLEYLVTSPAMHSIHHSSDPRDFNRNFSTGLSLFDILFGTFRKSNRVPPSDFKIGLDDKFDWEKASVWTMMIRPFTAIIKK